jgi:hypothetical protein
MYGSSATGNKVLKKYSLNKPDKEILKKINLENKSIQILQENIKLIGE